ncbi:MAG: hypothetical protein E6K66_07280 [Nitrospirae bacterium]|nr:MAG: hypothetical protein E6K66_07280 [Nitrospirota bacterium]
MTKDNPFNPMNAADSRNPASPINRGAYDVPVAPVRLALDDQAERIWGRCPSWPPNRCGRSGRGSRT